MSIDAERDAFEQLAKEMGYRVDRRENGIYDSSHTDLMRTTWNAALAYESESKTEQPVELSAKIWKRESTQEWVLEIEGTVDDVHLSCRHTEPLTTAKSDVAGLPTLYKAIERESIDLSHAELCRLGQLFGHNADLRTEQDRNINEWLKNALASKA